MNPPKDLIEQTLQEVVDKFLIPRFMMLGMKATGQWLQSLEVVAMENKGVIKGEKYTEQLVFGRRPGALPPVSAIEKWVNAKLGIYGEEATSMAWAISKKIAAEGTIWYKKGGSNLLEVLEEPATVNYIYQKIGGWYRLQVANELRRYAKQKLEVA